MTGLRTWSVPERTLRQRSDALVRANEVRFARARFKRDVKAGRESVVGLLLAEECPDLFATMKVAELVLSLPKVGRVKTNRIIVQHSISPSRTVGGMTVRQRTALAATLMPYDVGG